MIYLPLPNIFVFFDIGQLASLAPANQKNKKKTNIFDIPRGESGARPAQAGPGQASPAQARPSQPSLGQVKPDQARLSSDTKKIKKN